MPAQHPAMRINDLLNTKYLNVNIDDAAVPSPLFPDPQFTQATVDFTSIGTSPWPTTIHPNVPSDASLINQHHPPPQPPQPPQSGASHFNPQQQPFFSYPFSDMSFCMHVPPQACSSNMTTTIIDQQSTQVSLIPTPQSTPPLQQLNGSLQAVHNNLGQDSYSPSSVTMISQDHGHRDRPPMHMHPNTNGDPTPAIWFNNIPNQQFVHPSTSHHLQPSLTEVSESGNVAAVPRAGSEPLVGGRMPSGRWSGGNGTPILLDLPSSRDPAPVEESANVSDPAFPNPSDNQPNGVHESNPVQIQLPLAPPYEAPVQGRKRMNKGHALNHPANSGNILAPTQNAQEQADANDSKTSIEYPPCPPDLVIEDGIIIMDAAKSMQRPFSCAFCGRSFWRRYDCKRHMRVHTDEKPFPCNICLRRFSRKDALNRHLQASGCCTGASVTQTTRPSKKPFEPLPPPSSSKAPVTDPVPTSAEDTQEQILAPANPHSLTESWRASVSHYIHLSESNHTIANTFQENSLSHQQVHDPQNAHLHHPAIGILPPNMSIPMYGVSPLQLTPSSIGSNPLTSPMGTGPNMFPNPCLGQMVNSVPHPGEMPNISPVFMTHSPAPTHSDSSIHSNISFTTNVSSAGTQYMFSPSHSGAGPPPLYSDHSSNISPVVQTFGTCPQWASPLAAPESSLPAPSDESVNACTGIGRIV